MEIYLLRLIESFITPPGIFIVTTLAGFLLLKRRYYRASNIIFVSSFIVFYVFSLPITGKLLLSILESVPPLTETQIKLSPAKAIVVLGASRYKQAPEYKRDVVSENSLVRLRYAAHIHQLTKLPILVSGGNPMENNPTRMNISLALLMQRELGDFFNIKNVWLEGRSINTWENATFSTEILKQKNIKHVFLVTQAWHLPRAIQAFRGTGISVTPAPTGFRGNITIQSLSIRDFLPNSGSFLSAQCSVCTA